MCVLTLNVTVQYPKKIQIQYRYSAQTSPAGLIRAHGVEDAQGVRKPLLRQNAADEIKSEVLQGGV